MNHQKMHDNRIVINDANNSVRTQIINYISEIYKDDLSLLEVGPLDKPWLVRYFPNAYIKYADFANRSQLADVYKNDPNVDVSLIPNIDYPFHINSTTVCDVAEKFSLVFSSHCVEHQPNFIDHLNSIATILEPNGYYAFVCPDYRYSFDFLKSPTTMFDVLSRFYDNKACPSFFDIVTQRFCNKHSFCDYPDYTQFLNFPYERSLSLAFDNAHDHINISRQQFDKIASDINYNDVHCSFFTPYSIAVVLDLLLKLQYINFNIVFICSSHDDKYRHEFSVILQKI